MVGSTWWRGIRNCQEATRWISYERKQRWREVLDKSENGDELRHTHHVGMLPCLARRKRDIIQAVTSSIHGKPTKHPLKVAQKIITMHVLFSHISPKDGTDVSLQAVDVPCLRLRIRKHPTGPSAVLIESTQRFYCCLRSTSVFTPTSSDRSFHSTPVIYIWALGEMRDKSGAGAGYAIAFPLTGFAPGYPFVLLELCRYFKASFGHPSIFLSPPPITPPFPHWLLEKTED